MKSIRAIVVSCTFLLALGAFAQEPAKPSDQSQPEQKPQQAPPQTTQPQPPTIDDQVKALALELNLDAPQQAKVKTILEDQRTQAMTVVNDSAMPREDKVQKIRAIREGTIAKVRALLNDDQKKKLDQMLEEPNEPAHKEPPQANPTPK
jgi:hypothetical protein